jgi:hypothetical protein
MKKRKADAIIARRQADYDRMTQEKDPKALYYIMQGRGFHKPASPKK